MATIAEGHARPRPRLDVLSGTPRAHSIDRWIFVFMAAWFIAIVLAGFIPDSLEKIAAVQAGERPPFPLVLHMHAVLMGSFLLLLLGQAWLMATGRTSAHMKLGLVSVALVPALVAVGFLLVPTIYHQVWQGAQSAPAGAREQLQAVLPVIENIMLLQIRVGILFPLLVAIALVARKGNSGLHKRMMFLAVAMALPAGIDRIPWLPHTMPANPLSADLYTLAAVAPMFIWDVLRNRFVHQAYLVWLAISLPLVVVTYALWDTSWWHQTARQIMGVG
jgi:hypothetical protein